MMMMEYFEQGYEVVFGSMWGDVVMEDADMVECYEEEGEYELVRVDEEAHSVYFYDAHDYSYDD